MVILDGQQNADKPGGKEQHRVKEPVGTADNSHWVETQVA